jgi:hypothetical protein
MVKLFEVVKETNEDFWNKVETECSDSVSAIRGAGGNPIFRGYKGDYEPGKKYMTGNRDPKDTSKPMQTLVDKVLKLSGFEALRGNSIFVTGEILTANQYGDGKIYLIFPINGFSFTWSEKFRDFFEDFAMSKPNPESFLVNSMELNPDFLKLESAVYSFFNSFSDAIAAASTGESPEILRLLDKIYFETVKMKEMLRKGSKFKTKAYLESMFSYYQKYRTLVSDPKFKFNADQIKILSDINRWTKIPNPVLDVETAIATASAYRFRKDGLADAILSNNEIYIKGEFYAFDFNQYGDFFDKKLNDSN